jgi:general secretion pathway protein D
MLARQANAGIVISDEVKGVVNVNLEGMTIDEAFRLVAAQAGLAYRRIGNVYVVAPADSLKKVLANYLTGREERVALENIAPATAQTQIEAAFPFVTARPAGQGLLLAGAPEDIQQARALLQQIDSPAPSVAVESASMALTYAPAEDIEKVLTNQFTGLKAQRVGDSAIAFSGPRTDVERARAFIRELDRGKEANARYAVYRVKYASPFSLADSLRNAVKNLTVATGPESYYIPPAQLRLLSAQSLGGGQAGGQGGFGGGGQGGIGGGFGGGQGGFGGGGQGGIGGGFGGGQGGFGGGAGAGTGAGGTGMQGLGERTRTLILGGTEETVQAALKLTESLDKATPQVVLDVKVVSTNPQTSQSLGIDWSNGGQGTAASVSTTIFERPSAVAADIPNSPLVRQGFGIGNFGRLPIQFSATLNAFFRRDDVKIMAKPTITALDNEPGVVFVGETRRVSVSAIPGTPGVGGQSVILNQVVEIPVGIILQMRPRVNEDDLITLHVHPIYSSIGSVDPRTGLFSTFQREADTTVRVKSGETIVIGGLLQEEDTKSVVKIPILGDIPLIGQFFRNTTRASLRREVLVFVTPHLINDSI